MLIDVHGHLDLARGLELAQRLEPLNLFWLEEVTPAKPLETWRRSIEQGKCRPPGARQSMGPGVFCLTLAAKAVDIAMPDVKYCGGVLELKKIAAIAEGARYAGRAPLKGALSDNSWMEQIGSPG